MAGVNRVLLVGNLGADAELKVIGKGDKATSVINLRVATSESWKKEDGTREERTEWHQVSLFGKRAEGLAPHLLKGQTIFVEGRLRTRTYEKEGQKHYATNIDADNIQFVGGKPGGARSSDSDDDEFPPPPPPAAKSNNGRSTSARR